MDFVLLNNSTHLNTGQSVLLDSIPLHSIHHYGKHENGKPVAVSPDTIQLLSESWSKIQKSGLLEAGVALYKRYSWALRLIDIILTHG